MQVKTISSFFLFSSTHLIFFLREEEPIDLARTFLVSEFDSTFTTDKILADSRFGEAKVKWIDDTSCVVTVKNGDVKEVAERVKKFDDWKITVLSDASVGDLKEPPLKKHKPAEN
jgi:hypothetical protein